MKGAQGGSSLPPLPHREKAFDSNTRVRVHATGVRCGETPPVASSPPIWG